MEGRGAGTLRPVSARILNRIDELIPLRRFSAVDSTGASCGLQLAE